MSGTESSDRHHALRELGQADGSAPPPFGYEEFARRCTRRAARRRAAGWGAASSLLVAGVIIGLAMRAEAPRLMYSDTVAQSLPASGPALVNVGHAVLQEDLADRIAWFDAALSAGGAADLPSAELNQMRRTRDELESSLQRVAYAHALLEY